MFNQKPLSVAVHRVFTSVAIAATAAAPTVGQAQEKLEEIVVTGSHITQTGLESVNPISVVSHEEIVTTGLVDVGSFVQRIPSMSGSPIGTTTNNGGNGSVEIDLRGLGVDRTLTLVNGQRVVDEGDYQTIPTAMIERVEVLKGGASAIYGADAVAGVVNIITRQDFEGVTFGGQTGEFFDMDNGTQWSVDMIAGRKFERGHFVFGAEYVDQEEAFQSDAPWDFFQNSYYIYPEGCEAHPTLPYDGTPTGGCYPIGSSRIPEGRLQFANQGTFMNPDGTGLVPYDGRTYNYAPVNYIQTPYDRFNLFAEGRFDVTDSIQFFTSFRSNFRDSAQELAPQPYNSPTDPAFEGTFGGVPYNGISENNFYLVRAVTAAGLAAEPVTDARRRVVELNRRFTQEITQWQGVFGFEGTFNEMDWSVSYNKGYRSRTDQDFGQFYGPSLANAMGPSADLDGDGSPECYRNIADPTTLIVGCVPIDFFGGAGSITQEMIDYVGVDLIDSFVSQQDIASGTLSGTAFTLPGGELGWAVGAGWWLNDFEYSPDSAKQQDQVTGNVGAGTEGSLESYDLFIEVNAPVYDNGTQTLTLKGGLRYDNYDAFGGDETWQIGGQFQAVSSVKLRGMVGTVFRAPTVSDLFGGVVDNFPTYTDPCIPGPGQALPPGCAQVGVQLDSQVLTHVGGNPDLTPETGDTYTAGIVFTPDFGKGDFSATVDWWKTKIDDGISSLGIQFILDDCYVNQNAASCALITRAPDYSVAEVIDTSLNVAAQGAEGIDVEIRYAFDMDFGNFDVSLLWSHLLDREKTPFADAPVQHLDGRYLDVTAEDGGAYPEDKINYTLQWSRDIGPGSLTLSYLGQYISGLDADTFCNCVTDPYIQKVDSFLYHDIVGSYEFPTHTRVTFGVTNLSDEAPPFVEIGFNATTDPSLYRMFGTGYWLRVEQSF